MTLRTRLAILTSAAVAVAILAASVAAWVMLRSTLLAEVDQRLTETLPELDRIAELAEVINESDPEALAVSGRLPVLRPEPIGFQQLGPDGAVVRSLPPGDIEFALDPVEQELLAGSESGTLLRTETVDGESYRVLSAALPDGRFLRMVHPLAGVETTMARMTWLLIAVAGTGVAAAGGLGWTVARAGLRPVDRLAAAAEQVAKTRDLAHRIDTSGAERDEVTRLARSVNAMLSALDHAQTQQRHLVEDAGHELRTPLATLRTDIGVLLRAEQHPERTLPAGDRQRLLADLETEAATLSALVAELVELARGDLEPEPLLETDLRALVERAVARTRRVAAGITVTVRGGGFEAAVRPAMLERAITNLLRNAAQVSDPGGRIEVELAEQAGWVTVRVRDRGPGIAEADLPRLFDRFYRGEAARERPGSGLGLAIVAQAAQQHGGSVEAGNRPGGGAEFTLRVPVRPAAADS